MQETKVPWLSKAQPYVEMLPRQTGRRNGPRVAVALAAAGALLALTITVQWLTGAYTSEFGGYPDEPAHYVTGLLILDYVTSGIPQGPLAYAREYYNHYPKVALGNWPPVFYLLQAAWTVLFGPGRVSIILLMGVLTASLAWLIYLVLKPEFAGWKAFTGAVMFILLPLVQSYGGMIMTEIPIALFAFLAMLCYGRFLDHGQMRDALLFGVFAAIAILTKGSAVSLALAAPIALVLSRRLQLLKTIAFWTPLPIVLILAGPWTWLFRREASAGWSGDRLTWNLFSEALVFYPRELVLAVGAPLFAFAILGMFAKLRVSNSTPPGGKWAAAAGLLMSVLAIHLLIPSGAESRHLIVALPAMVMFIVAGVEKGAALIAWQRPASARTTALVWSAAVVGFFIGVFQLESKATSGFGAVAERLLLDPAHRDAKMLISSDATGEGVFIAEIAMREQRPGHIVRRASKTLASSRWSGAGYQAKFERPADVLAALDQDGIALIVTDASIPADLHKPHHDQLCEALATHPDRFVLLTQFPCVRGGKRHDKALSVWGKAPVGRRAS